MRTQWILRAAFLVSFPALFYAATKFTYRGGGAVPWWVLPLGLFLAGVILAIEWALVRYFAEYLSLAIWGFLAGALSSYLVLALIGPFVGVTWMFTSGTGYETQVGIIVVGFLGAVLATRVENPVKLAGRNETLPPGTPATGPRAPYFRLIIRILAVIAFALFVYYVRRYLKTEATGASGSDNPLKKPVLWYILTFVFLFAVELLLGARLGTVVKIVLPGVLFGMIWAYVGEKFVEIYGEVSKAAAGAGDQSVAPALEATNDLNAASGVEEPGGVPLPVRQIMLLFGFSYLGIALMCAAAVRDLYHLPIRLRRE